MNYNDLTITSLETITGFDILTGAYLFTLDELQNTTIANTQEKEEITGKQGRKISSLKKNKAVTISGNNGMISGGLLALQTGSDLEHKETSVLWTDYLIVNANNATTTHKAAGTAGNEIESVYVKNSDGTLGRVLTQNASAGSGVFSYNPTSKVLTFAEGEIADGTEIIAYYKRKVQGDVLENISDRFSRKCVLYIDAMAEDKCSNVYRVQFYIPKADFSGDFDIQMGDSQTVHAFEAEAMSGAGCGISGNSSQLWTYMVFGANAEDAA